MEIRSVVIIFLKRGGEACINAQRPELIRPSELEMASTNEEMYAIGASSTEEEMPIPLNWVGRERNNGCSCCGRENF